MQRGLCDHAFSVKALFKQGVGNLFNIKGHISFYYLFRGPDFFFFNRAEHI